MAPPPGNSARRTGLTLVWLLALARVVLHLWTHRGYGIFRDELYYIACGEHLSLGYVDHPPLVGWLAWLVRSTLGDSLLALRFVPALAGGATVLLAGLLCRALGGEQRAQLLSCLAVAMSPVLLSFGFFFSMNVFEPVFWSAAALVLVRIAQAGSPRLWLWFGAIAGVGLLNKHSMLFFGFGVAVACLLTPELRRTLSTRWPWLGLALAFALFSPNLLWEVQNNFATLEFMENARKFKNAALPPSTFLAEQLLEQGPLAAPLWIAGAWFALRPGANPGARPIALAFLALLTLFLITGAKPYYLAAAFPMLFAASAAALEARAPKLTLAASGVVLAGGLLSLPMAIPILSELDYLRYSKALGIAPTPSERHEQAELPQFFADMHGWRELAQDVARAWSKIPAEQRKHCIIYTRNYGQAGAIDLFGPALGLPRAVSGHNSYYLWSSVPQGTDCALYVGGDQAFHQQSWRRIDALDNSERKWTMPFEHVTLWLLREPRAPMSELLVRWKHFI
jgi:hypothetical protein